MGRRAGVRTLKTASDGSLDAGVVLAVRAATPAEEDGVEGVVVATTNPRRLSRFVDARPWEGVGSWAETLSGGNLWIMVLRLPGMRDVRAEGDPS